MVGELIRGSRRGRLLLALLACASALLGLAAAEAGAAQGGLGSAPSAESPTTTSPTTVRTPFFPVRGAHEYWAGFGDGRGHEGADVGARCGTPLVAVSTGRITMREYHARAGNYVVLDLKGTDLDLAYMHLVRPALTKVGTVVHAGQLIGNVGETGNASGCHLHFEVWEGEYYGGGSAVDPMPYLESWDRAKRARR